MKNNERERIFKTKALRRKELAKLPSSWRRWVIESIEEKTDEGI
ncbi:MAG: hypothetical protein AB1410_08175 [Acidobacteriota bacterium]